MKRLILILSLLLFISNLASAENQFFIKPHSNWVQQVGYELNSHLNVDNKEDGGIYLLVDFQQDVALQEFYQHFVIKIDEETGIQNYSDLWINYDPSYQQLIFHKLVIHRNNQEINRLVKEDFNVVQNETELKRKIYSGNYSAGINIKGVQAGDIVEYAYTIKGENPIFKGKYLDWFNLNFSNPISKLSLLVSYPENRPIQYKLINSAIEPDKTVKNNQVYLKWVLNNVEEVVSNSDIPSWYMAYDRVHFSEFSSWAEVVGWSKPLYKKIDITNTPLEIKVDELTKDLNNIHDKIDKLISFVQDEIRYVGIEIDEYSHKPHNPLEVYTNRYGDCKDKSYLLVTLLNHLGVEAWPAYVNTSLKHKINELLPSPVNFNHVIVAINIDDQAYFIDPTKSNQKGSFKTAYSGNYERALVISDKYKEPVNVPLRSTEKIIINETIDAADTAKPAKYSLVCTYYGDEADQLRSTFNNNTQKELKSSYLNFYDNIYPNMKVIGDIKAEDNEEENSFTVFENYEIENFWKFNNSKSVNDYESSVNATSLNYYVTVPSQKNRTMPYALYYPIEIENHIEFDIQRAINITEAKGEINNPNFSFKYHVRKKGKIVVFDYTYKTLTDHVSVDQLSQYYKDIDVVKNLIWYEFTYGYNLGNNWLNKLNWLLIVFTVFFITILIIFASKLYKKDIEVDHARNSPLAIGGWLVIPVIGVIISPILLTYGIYTNNYFNQSVWEFISSPESNGYNIIWSVAFILELFTNSLLLVYVLFLIVLLIKKRTIFPSHYVTYLTINLLFAILNTFLISQIESDYFENTSIDYRSILRAVFGAAIWIPYMMKSRRVKNTFINKHKKQDRLTD